MEFLPPIPGVGGAAAYAFIGYTRTKISTFGEKVAEGGPMQIAIGESLAELDAAFALAERVNEVLFAEQPMTLQHRVRHRRNVTAASRLALRAVDRLFDLGGAQGLTETGALQRHWRDAHAMAHHYGFNGISFQNSGRLSLGLGMTPGDALY